MAKRFYLKLRYDVFRVTYRLGYELLDKSIEVPCDVNLKSATLDDILSLVKFTKEWNVPLIHFVKVYERESDKALVVLKGNERIGFVIAETDEYNRDLLTIKYLWMKDDKVNNFLTLVNSIMYVASLKGYRWLGVSLDNEKLVNELKKRGWIENLLPTFMNTIYMEKYLLKDRRERVSSILKMPWKRQNCYLP